MTNSRKPRRSHLSGRATLRFASLTVAFVFATVAFAWGAVATLDRPLVAAGLAMLSIAFGLSAGASIAELVDPSTGPDTEAPDAAPNDTPDAAS